MSQRVVVRSTLAEPICIAMFGLLVALPLVLLAPLGWKLVGIGFGALMGLCTVRLAKRELVLDESGITQLGAFSQKQLAWEDVDHYTFYSANPNAVYVGGAQAGAAGVIAVVIIAGIVAALRKKGPANRKFAQGRMTLIGRNRRKIAIGTTYKDVASALDRAFLEVHARLRARPDVSFEPFALAATELSHGRKGKLGLADIDKVSAAGSRIAIRRRGKRLAWAAARMGVVKNSILFLEQLAERGVAVTAQDEVFMPPSIADKLRAATARQAAIPSARVVVRD